MLHLTLSVNGLGKDNYNTRIEVLKFWDFDAAYIRGFTVLVIWRNCDAIVANFTALILNKTNKW